MTADIQIRGADQFESSMTAAADDLADLDERAGPKAGRLLVQSAVRRAPRQSGALAGSIRAVTGGDDVLVTAGGGRVTYAGVQEYGSRTRNIRPARFLRGALDAETDRVTDVYAAQVTDITDTVKGI